MRREMGNIESPPWYAFLVTRVHGEHSRLTKWHLISFNFKDNGLIFFMSRDWLHPNPLSKFHLYRSSSTVLCRAHPLGASLSLGTISDFYLRNSADYKSVGQQMNAQVRILVVTRKEWRAIEMDTQFVQWTVLNSTWYKEHTTCTCTVTNSTV